jgi:uncharacterized protein (DUF433 family)
VALTARGMLNYSAAVDYSKIITIEPGKRSGKPCIRGMRITVQDVFEYLAGGMTEDQILEDFPELTREDINACFAFAADRERKLFHECNSRNIGDRRPGLCTENERR